MPVALRISYDRPTGAYYAGETLSGRVHLRVDEPTRIRGESPGRVCLSLWPAPVAGACGRRLWPAPVAGARRLAAVLPEK